MKKKILFGLSVISFTVLLLLNFTLVNKNSANSDLSLNNLFETASAQSEPTDGGAGGGSNDYIYGAECRSNGCELTVGMITYYGLYWTCQATQDQSKICRRSSCYKACDPFIY